MTAGIAVARCLRKTKQDGYKTCPFDLCVSNYIGIIKCIREDFKYFCDPNYLTLRDSPGTLAQLPPEALKYNTDKWIFNTYYNFGFNHESPYHGNLHITEGWSGGPNHFVDNNYEKFIERYTNRINNFRNYISQPGVKINFIIGRYNSLPVSLQYFIETTYPHLNFNILVSLDNFDRTDIQHEDPAIRMPLLRYMVDENEHPEEYSRFVTPSLNYAKTSLLGKIIVI
jgi:hypothetical protein